MEFIQGCVKEILDRCIDPVFDKVKDITKAEWEKFKIDTDIVFTKYFKNSYDKYSKIKTVLYRTEPKYLYDFFEYPSLSKDRGNTIDSSDINNVIDISNFLIVQGIGGIGKSTFMKHLFINELEKKELIPVFIELRDINDADNDFEIQDFIFKKLNILGSGIKKEFLDYALKSGCFLFLLDGYDEILSDKKKIFFKKITDFCDNYNENVFVISSRPYSEFVEFERFTVLTVKPFTKEQAISLINKIDFDTAIKARFVQNLEQSLYVKHRSFASNPLLLNIMLLTYDNYAEIPEKLHLFYANAFDTLYFKHDATKGGYRREIMSKSSVDIFKKIFSNFCFRSYFQGKTEFTKDELTDYLIKSFPINCNIDTDAYISDLVDYVCLLFKDGFNYRFTHRSFQEYFAALFLKELSDQTLQNIGIKLIEKDIYRATHDNVFVMLFDMAQERVEQNILIPILDLIEAGVDTEKYDFYISNSNTFFEFQNVTADDNDCELVWVTEYGAEDTYFDFICNFVSKYKNTNYAQENNAAKELLDYIRENENYNINDEIRISSLKKGTKTYELFKKTWIGERINTVADLKERLIDKRKKFEFDINDFIDSQIK